MDAEQISQQLKGLAEKSPEWSVKIDCFEEWGGGKGVFCGGLSMFCVVCRQAIKIVGS